MYLKRGFILNNKKVIKFISIIMALFIMSFSFSGNFVYASDINNIEPPNPGSLDINKLVAPVPGKTNQWEVTLTMTGKNLPVTSDIVLVIDTSGSMKGDRLTSAKTAARNFINTLLTNTNTTTRIAVVSFAENVIIHNVTNQNNSLAFRGFNDKQTLLNSVDSLSANDGTFTQAGIKTARELLNSSNALSKNIVLLSDGEPTYSYKLNNPDNYLVFYNSRFFGDDYETKLIIPEIQYNYAQKTGNGSDYRYNYKSFGLFGAGDRYHYNHGNSTINESNFIKNENITLYSIALSAGETGNYVLNNVASPGKSYTASTSDLNSVFQTIAGHIAYAATNAVVTDPIGEKFSIPGISATNYAQKISVNQGTLAWNNNTETITWTLDTISEGNPSVMKYIVQIDSNVQSGQVYSTNGETLVTYTNSLGQNARKTFPMPKAGVNAGTIQIHYYRVNKTGQPVNSQGTQITKEQAEIQNITYQEGTNLQLNVPYNVTGPSGITIGGKLYAYTSIGNVGTVNPITITLTPALPSQHVWFAYSEVKDVNVTFNENYDGAPLNYIRTTREGTSLGLNMPVAPVRAGYIFNGWKNSIDSSGQVFNQNTTITVNTTVYAQWIKDASKWHTVTFYEGTNGSLTGTTVFTDILDGTPWNDKIVVPGTSANTGYVFNGWSSNFPETITQDLSFTANWKRSIFKLTITYVYAGGANVTFEDSRPNPKIIDVVAGSSHTEVSPAISGYIANKDINIANMDKDKEETVYYSIVKSVLRNNSMYKNVKAEPIGKGNGSFNIVKNIDYTFGLEISLGNKNLSTVIETTGDIKLSEFKLFDKDKKEVANGITVNYLSNNKYEIAFNSANNLLIVNNIYTITYKIKSGSETNASLKVIRDVNKLNLLESAKEEINIKTINMPNLE